MRNKPRTKAETDTAKVTSSGAITYHAPSPKIIVSIMEKIVHKINTK